MADNLQNHQPGHVDDASAEAMTLDSLEVGLETAVAFTATENAALNQALPLPARLALGALTVLLGWRATNRLRHLIRSRDVPPGDNTETDDEQEPEEDL